MFYSAYVLMIIILLFDMQLKIPTVLSFLSERTISKNKQKEIWLVLGNNHFC